MTSVVYSNRLLYFILALSLVYTACFTLFYCYSCSVTMVIILLNWLHYFRMCDVCVRVPLLCYVFSDWSRQTYGSFSGIGDIAFHCNWWDGTWVWGFFLAHPLFIARNCTNCEWQPKAPTNNHVGWWWPVSKTVHVKCSVLYCFYKNASHSVYKVT